MTTLDVTTTTQNQARQALCDHIKKWCEQGVSNVKVRVNTSNHKPDSVWSYGRVKNAWKKSDSVAGPEVAGFIQSELERLATSSHTEECQIRRKEFVDRTEFEIKFHHEVIVAHQGEQLNSYLFGVLFRERHEAPDSKPQGVHAGGKARVTRV